MWGTMISNDNKMMIHFQVLMEIKMKSTASRFRRKIPFYLQMQYSNQKINFIQRKISKKNFACSEMNLMKKVSKKTKSTNLSDHIRKVLLCNELSNNIYTGRLSISFLRSSFSPINQTWYKDYLVNIILYVYFVCAVQ